MELVIFVGLQGAGKSTFYAEQFAATHARLSKDLMPQNRHKQQRQMQLLAEALAAGESVVIDNTNATAADRAPLIQLGREYGATITGYYFTTPLALCMQRNYARTGHARVPDIAIYATRKRMQVPIQAEGFDALWEVRSGADGTATTIPIEND